MQTTNWNPMWCSITCSIHRVMGHVHNKQGRQGTLFSASFRSVNQHSSVLNWFLEVKNGLRHEIPVFFVQTDIILCIYVARLYHQALIFVPPIFQARCKHFSCPVEIVTFVTVLLNDPTLSWKIPRTQRKTSVQPTFWQSNNVPPNVPLACGSVPKTMFWSAIWKITYGLCQKCHRKMLSPRTSHGSSVLDG